MKILCADDISMVCQFVQKALTEVGHTFVAVADGQQAWDKIAADPSAYDLILTDIAMPRMDGLEFIRLTRKTSFSGRIVVQSSGIDSQTTALLMELNVDRIIAKPYDPYALQVMVAAFAGLQ
jgi:CheY-like chemotaxis protein